MTWILWRYTTVELWRVVLLSAAILVAVIAFAATVKPLAEGALSPGAAIRFMLLAVPPMLAYALPFAAGFGATLAYHRMAQDNEVVAAQSGGVSHRGVLVPAIASGLLFAGTMVGLNDWVIPRFLHSMERMITMDVAQLVVQRIESGQSAELESFTIYGERIDRLEPPTDAPRIQQLFRIQNGAAIELNDEGEVIIDATFRRAWIALGRSPVDESRMICGIQLEDGVGHRVGQGLVHIEKRRMESFLIPDAFSNDPKYLTWRELRELRTNPARMGFVEERRMRLAEVFALGTVEDRLRSELSQAGRMTLRGPDTQRVEITADAALRADDGAWLLTRDEGEPVAIRRYETGEGGEMRIYFESAREAWLRLDRRGEAESLWDDEASGTSFRFTLQLVEVRTESDRGLVTEVPTREVRELRLADDPLAGFASMSSAELLAEAGGAMAAGAAPPGVEEAAKRLRDRIAKLQREITSKQHERMAMAASCFVMVVLGAIMALRHRDSIPLVVYLWSFFPALAMILLISSGQQHTHGHNVTVGLTILWSGVIAGAAISLVAYLKVARH